MSSIFSKIIEKTIPSYTVAENDEFIAFLDINPISIGHTLVVPKKEIDYIFDMPDTDLAGLMVFSKKVAAALKKVVPCKRIGISVVGFEVPHAHVHLIPINKISDMNSSNPKIHMDTEEFIKLTDQIKKIVNI